MTLLPLILYSIILKSEQFIAKVNGKIVPLDYKLQSGDQIEILTSKSQFPTKEWLKLCVTNKAQNFIQKYINDEKKKIIESGRNIYDNSLGQLHISLKDYQTDLLIKHLHFSSLDEMLYDIGNEKIDKLLLINSISNWYETNYSKFKRNNKKNKRKENLSFKEKSNGSNFDSSLPIKYAQCCYPLPNDEIIGILNEQMEITVHRINCKKVLNQLLGKEASIFNLEWSNLPPNDYLSKIFIQGEEIPSLISDISSMIISLNKASIKGFNFDSNEKWF